MSLADSASVVVESEADQTQEVGISRKSKHLFYLMFLYCDMPVVTI